MNPYPLKEDLCSLFNSHLLFAWNKNAHLAETINHDIHVIMPSLGHRQYSNKIHGNVVPWSQRNWKWHVQTNLSIAWLACQTHHTSFNVFHNCFIHTRPITLPLNLCHLFFSYLFFAWNNNAHLAESINHDIHVIISSPGHRKSSEKVHGNVIPWSQRN